MHRQGVALHAVGPAVDPVGELNRGQHLATALQQGLQQGPLTARQGDRLAVQPEPLGRRFEPQAAVLDHRRGAAGGAAHQGVQAGHQLVQVKGFHQVVIGAGVQSRHPVLDAVPGGEHQHRLVPPQAAPARQQRQPVLVGQTQIEHHQVKGGTVQGGVGIGGAGHPGHGKAVGLKTGLHAVAEQGVVFDQ